MESGTLDDLVTQVVPALVGGIEEVLHIRVMTTQQVVDKGTPIAAQPCTVAHDALCVETDNHLSQPLTMNP